MSDAIRTFFVFCAVLLTVCGGLYAATFFKATPESEARKRRRLRLVSRDRRRFWFPDDEDGGRAA